MTAGATEQIVKPPMDILFQDNNSGISAQGPDISGPEIPRIVQLARDFEQARGLDIKPHIPYEMPVELNTKPVDPNDQIHMDDNDRMRIPDSANGVSQSLNDNSMEGVKVEPTGQQSDLCFGIGSVLGVTKEALGCGIKQDAGMDMSSLVPQEQRFNPMLRPFPTAGMSR